ncbi:MAG: hypothetical protein P4L93_06550 [Coriobacteriia bacterium]|nr:hypothetical protein [Coriobacteriia bacterium]
MHWLQLFATVLYVAGLIGCGVLVWRLLEGGYPKPRAIQAGFALAPAALLVGLLLAAQVVPSSNLWMLTAVYAPYFAFSAWALYFSLFLQRGAEPSRAALRAVLWTVPSLLLTPLAIGILEFLLPPR